MGSQSASVFSAESVVKFSGTRTRVPVTLTENSWSDEAIQRLEQLVRLPPGWDGYYGQPVSLVNASFALAMLDVICAPEARPPQIVPGSEGDLQIEWHTQQGDLELHIKAPNDVHAWFERTGAESISKDLKTDFAVAVDWVMAIAAESTSGNAVAA